MTSTGRIQFSAGTKHRLAVPGTLNLDLAKLRDITVTLPDADELASGSAPPGIELTATIAGALSPIKAVVYGFGVALALDADLVATGRDAGSVTESMAIAPPSPL